MESPDTIITPAEPENILQISDPSETAQPRAHTNLNELRTLLSELRDNLTGILESYDAIDGVHHLVTTPECKSILLNLNEADLHVIHTSSEVQCFINVITETHPDLALYRKNYTIINKGSGTIVLCIRNIIDDLDVLRTKILKPYRKYDVSVIYDGAHTLIC